MRGKKNVNDEIRQDKIKELKSGILNFKVAPEGGTSSLRKISFSIGEKYRIFSGWSVSTQGRIHGQPGLTREDWYLGRCELLM